MLSGVTIDTSKFNEFKNIILTNNFNIDSLIADLQNICVSTELSKTLLSLLERIKNSDPEKIQKGGLTKDEIWRQDHQLLHASGIILLVVLSPILIPIGVAITMSLGGGKRKNKTNKRNKKNRRRTSKK